MSRWSVADIPEQNGRTVLVTGANSGLGLRTATVLACRGATVLMACRDRQRPTAPRNWPTCCSPSSLIAGPWPQAGICSPWPPTPA
ncbi:MAG: hypothetical protein ACRDTF_05880 [Pseudonocardiaceae bacterium]